MYQTITTNIMVKNVQETVDFYVEKLGFKKVLTVPESGEKLDFAIIARDQVSLMFQEQENLLSEYPTLQTAALIPTFTLFITVDDVERLYHALEGKVKIARKLHQTFYGKDEFAIFDNNGNVLTISC